MRVRAHTVQVRMECFGCVGSFAAQERTFFNVPVGQEARVACLETLDALASGWREVTAASIHRGDAYTIYAVGVVINAICPHCARADSPLFGTAKVSP
jgi:hypothetical protein